MINASIRHGDVLIFVVVGLINENFSANKTIQKILPVLNLYDRESYWIKGAF